MLLKWKQESESSSDEDISDKEEIIIPATPVKQAEKSFCIKVGSKNKKKWEILNVTN